jgi:uncharacterized RDD family membrane protein YckC
MQSGRRLTDLEPAGLARRTSAFAIDCALTALLLIALYRLLLATGLIPQSGAHRLLYAAVTFCIVFLLYFTIFESRGSHATFGKRLTGVDVVPISAARVSFRRALSRNVIKLLPILIVPAIAASSVAAFVDPVTDRFTIPALDALGAAVLGGILLALVLLGVLLFSIMLHPDGRGMHDVLAGTFVVRSTGDPVPGRSPTREAPVR